MKYDDKWKYTIIFVDKDEKFLHAIGYENVPTANDLILALEELRTDPSMDCMNRTYGVDMFAHVTTMTLNDLAVEAEKYAH